MDRTILTYLLTTITGRKDDLTFPEDFTLISQRGGRKNGFYSDRSTFSPVYRLVIPPSFPKGENTRKFLQILTNYRTDIS